MLSWKGDAWWMETLLCPQRLKGWTLWGEEAAKLCRQHLKFLLPHRYWLTIFLLRSCGSYRLPTAQGQILLPQLFNLHRNKTYYDWTEKRVNRVLSPHNGSQLICFITHWTSVEYSDVVFSLSCTQWKAEWKSLHALRESWLTPKPHTQRQNVQFYKNRSNH